MRIGIMQPYFFPYLGYWQLIGAVDKYVVYDDVNYIKGGWISRNNILLSGAAHMITLSLDNPSSYRLIDEIAVRNDPVGKKKILKTLEYAYSKAPYYASVIQMITDIIMMDTTIAGMNYEAVIRICGYLGIETEIILSSELDKDNELKGEDKVIHIVKKLGGDCYINAIGGKDLYSRERFKQDGIELLFLQKDELKYDQYGDSFVDNLSIIDALMFNSKEEMLELMHRYKLK